MKKTMFLLLSAFMAMVWVIPAAAATYHSHLGFSIYLPAGWKAVNYKPVTSNPKMLETVFDSAQKGSLRGADKDFMVRIKHMVRSGGVEYFVNKNNPGVIIGVNEIRGQLPLTSTAVDESCQSAPAQLSRYAGKTMQVYQCKSEYLGKTRALYLVADGFAKGNKSIEYQLQKTPATVLVFTATCPSKNFATTKRTFHEMMETVRID